MIELPPPIWTPAKPAIIRPAEDALLRGVYFGESVSRQERRKVLSDLVAQGQLSREQARRALVVGYSRTPGLAALTRSVTASTQVTAANDITWSNISIGAAPGAGERRFVFAVISRYQFNGTVTLVGVTIGGSAATYVVDNFDAAGVGNCIYYKEVSSGTTTNVVLDVTQSGGSGPRARCSIYRVIAKSNISVLDSGVSSTVSTAVQGYSINAGKGGVVMAAVFSLNNGGDTWTVLTEDDDSDINTNDFRSAASAEIAATSTITPTVTVDTGTCGQGVFASIIPVA